LSSEGQPNPKERIIAQVLSERNDEAARARQLNDL